MLGVNRVYSESILWIFRNNFEGLVFVKKLRVLKPGKPAPKGGGPAPERRARRAEWHHLVIGALAAGGVGVLSWIVLFPAASVVPAADRVSSQGLTVHAPTANPGQNGQSYASPLPSGAVPSGYYSAPPRTYASSSGSPHGSASSPAATGATAQAGATPAASPAPSTSPSVSVSPADSGSASTSPPSPFPVDSSSSFSVPPVFPVDSGTASSDPAVSTSPATSTSTSSGPPAAGALGLGFYDGESSPAGIETAANWLGSPSSVKYAQDFIDATDWSHIEDPWQLSNWQGSPFTMVWGVPMVPCGAPSTQCATNVADYNLVATGGADGYYQTLAQNLVSAGFGSSYIRLGWEFNADWMGWGICNADGSGLSSWAGDFVPAFQNIVTSMRGVAGANFKFIWNPIDSSNASCPGANLESFYPGDNYVDAVALDAYDGIGAATSSDAARFTDLENGVNAGGWTAVAPAAINGGLLPGLRARLARRLRQGPQQGDQPARVGARKHRHRRRRR